VIARPLANDRGLISRPLIRPRISRDIGVIRFRGRELTPAAAGLLALVKERLHRSIKKSKWFSISISDCRVMSSSAIYLTTIWLNAKIQHVRIAVGPSHARAAHRQAVRCVSTVSSGKESGPPGPRIDPFLLMLNAKNLPTQELDEGLYGLW